MSPTKARIIQYIIIITILTLASGAGYAWYSTRAAVNSKAATNQGLVGYWSFDEGSGTQAGDASGSGNTGTLTNGPTWVDGKLKKAINFDGTDDYIATSAGSGLTGVGTGNFMMCSWFKLNATGRNDLIVWKTSDGSKDLTLFVDSNSKVSLYLNGGFTTGTTSLVANQWYHVCAGRTASNTITIYLNGVVDASGSNSTDLSLFSTNIIWLGSNHTAFVPLSANDLNGFLDEVRMYNRALTATEITNLYNLGAARVNATKNSNLTNGLVGLWSFDGKDVSGTTAYDRSGSGNNGTLTNGPAPTLGKLGQALILDGSNDYVSVADNSVQDIEVGQAKTISSWIKIGTGSATKRFLWKNYECTGWLFGLDGTEHIALTYQTGNNYCTGPNTYAITSSGVHTDSQWHHVVGVVDRPSLIMRLYVDGVSVGSVAIDNTYFGGAGAGDMRIGTDWNNGLPFAGSIDDVRIYNRALSEGEIRDLYQMGVSDKVNSADAQTDPLERGLTGYWKLDENTGTTAADASGNGNTGTLTNDPTWTTGRIGSGVTFDGTDDYFLTNTLSLFTNTFTVSFWAKMSSSVGNDYILDYRTGNSLVAFRSSAGANDIFLRDASGNTPSGGQVSPGFLYDGNWHMYTITADGSNARAFRDGVQQGVERAWTYSIATGSQLTIGSNAYGITEHFNGSVDEVRAYNRALSFEELAKLYQTTTPDNPDTSLKGYWSFDGKDVSGTTAYDRSGSGANGTLTNGPVPTLGKLGQALNFDGTDDCVASVANSPDLAALTQTSVTFWIKPKAFLNRAIFTLLQTNNGGNGAFVNGFEIGSNMWTSTEAIRLAVDGTSVDLQARSNSLLPLNVWTHVVVTWGGAINGTDTKFYFDGTDVGTTVMQAGSGSYVAGDGRYRIGSMPGCAYGFLDGTLDDLRVYNRVLTATEVANLYNQSR